MHVALDQRDAAEDRRDALVAERRDDRQRAARADEQRAAAGRPARTRPAPSLTAAASAGTRPGPRRRPALDLHVRARRRRLAQQPLDLRRDDSPDPGRARAGSRRSPPRARAAPSSAAAASRPRSRGRRSPAQPRCARRSRAPRRRPCGRAPWSVSISSPGTSPLQSESSCAVGATTPCAQRLGQPPVLGHDARERLHQRVHRVQRAAAVEAGVQVALAGPHGHVEVREPARGDAELRDAALRHAAVEDQRRVRPALVLREEVDDRVAADLLLAVAGDAQVDRQLAGLRELLGRLEQAVELALVVGDAARDEPLAGDGQLERRRVPQLERRRRLHVEVAVDEHGRRVGGLARRADLADHERRRRAGLDELRLAAGALARSRAPRSAAATTSPACAGSALTLGMRMSSASSSIQACCTSGRVYARRRYGRYGCGCLTGFSSARSAESPAGSRTRDSERARPPPIVGSLRQVDSREVRAPVDDVRDTLAGPDVADELVGRLPVDDELGTPDAG